jgi:flavin-dependent dehydrogenase
LDAAKLPSDQPFSTHAIQPAGIDYLDELGVGARIREVTPPVRASRLAVGAARVDLRMMAARPMYCPRRTTLDPLLADAAVQAGAELRDQTAVLELLRDGDRVVGVRARHGTVTSDLRAKIVVGADGRNSTVAKQVRAEEYHPEETGRGGYWGYFPTTPAVEALPFQTYIEIHGADARFLFRTDGDLVVAGALAPLAVARTWSRDIGKHVRASMQQSDVIGPALQGGAEQVGRFVGLMRLRSFFRVPVGPGWALVGDAGLHKDPTPGYGITDALRDAKALSRAILDGRDAAYEVYWRERDVESIPLYANATAMGSLDYDNPFNELIIDKLQTIPELGARLIQVLDRAVSPFETIATWRVLAWTANALLRGRGEIWAPFLRSGQRGTWVGRELAHRRALLDRARQRLAAARG